MTTLPLSSLPDLSPVKSSTASDQDVQAWWEALRQGDLDLVRCRLNTDVAWARRLSPLGTSPLHEVLATPDYGSMAHRLTLIDLLLPHSNVRWDDEHPDGTTPLMLAAQSCQLSVIDRLLPLSNVRATSIDGSTALMVAATCGHGRVVETLLPLSDPLAVDRSGMSAAMWAARNGRTHALSVLLPVSSLVQRNADGDTVVHLAARHGMETTLRAWLNDSAVDLTLRNDHGDNVADLWDQRFQSTMKKPTQVHHHALSHQLRHRCHEQERASLLAALAAITPVDGATDPEAVAPALRTRPRL